MIVRLEFVGEPGPHRDPERFVASVRAAKPSLTEDDIVTIVRRGNARYKPRWDRALYQVFGADILGDDVTQIAAWSLIEPGWQQLLQQFPTDGGVVIPATAEGASAITAAIQSGDVATVNRQSLMRPAGMSRTYVWRKENGWIQDVTDADADILRNTPIVNQCFRNVDQADGPVLVRTYEYGEGERHRFDTFDDFERFHQTEQRRPTWRGV